MKFAALIKAKPRLFEDNQEIQIYAKHGSDYVATRKPFRNFYHDFLAVKSSENKGCFDRHIEKITPGSNGEIKIWLDQK